MAKKISLTSKVSNDDAYKHVIEKQAAVKRLQRENAALRKDRDDMLSEFEDYRTARSVYLSPKTISASKGVYRRVCVGDLHGMRQDKKAVNAFLGDAKELMPHEIVLGGDMVDCGGWLSKHFTLGYVAESDYSYQEDVEATNTFLDALQTIVPNAVIHYLEGNHEDRIERWCMDQTKAHARDADFLRRAFAPSILLRLKERGIKYYRRSEIYGKGLPRGWVQLGKMYFTHELGASQNAARQAVLKTAGNVTYFHTHREDTATVVYPSVGVVKAFCPGCLCQMQPMWKHSQPTSWSQGYGLDFVADDGTFQRVQIPIWRGRSLAQSMITSLRT